MTTLFRLLLALMLAFAFKPAGLVTREDWGSFSWLGGIILSPGYSVLIYLVIAVFGLGLFRRYPGFLLLLLLIPHACLNRGNQSRQVMLFVLLCVSLLPSRPLWTAWKERHLATAHAPAWPIRLVQLQLTVLYGFNALVKTTPHYLSGEALMGLSMRPNFHVNLTSGWLHVGPLSLPVWLLACSTVAIEYALALGMWFRKSLYPTAALGLLFHIGLTFMITIFMLDYVSLFLYLAFLIPFVEKRTPPVSHPGH